jgi:hypothetical protein
MKTVLYGLMVLLFATAMSSCKKEVNPTLIVTVVDTLGVKLQDVNVILHPCYFNQETCDTARLNPTFHKEQLSNGNGQATFEFPHSAVLDVVGFDAIKSSSGDTLGYYFGQTVVALETKELKKDEKNEYEVRLVIDKLFL